MSGGLSHLSYSQIESLASQLNSSAQNMEGLLNEIKMLFERIGTDDVWSGTAANSTKAEFDVLSAKFPEFSQAINDCYTYLLSVVEEYKRVDATISGN